MAEGGLPRPRRQFDLEFREQARNLPFLSVSPIIPPHPERDVNNNTTVSEINNNQTFIPGHIYPQPMQAFFIDSYLSTNTTSLGESFPNWVEVRVEGFIDVFLPHYGNICFQITYSRRVLLPPLVHRL